MQYDFLRRVLQKLKGFEKNRKSLYFRLKNYPNKSIFKDNLIFTDNLNKAVVSFAVEIFPKKDAVQKTRCFTYRTTPGSESRSKLVRTSFPEQKVEKRTSPFG